jgi:hypothetical protein
LLVAGLEKSNGRVVVDRFGVHGLNNAQFIHNFGGMGHQIAHPGAVVAVLFEVYFGADERKIGLVGGHAGKALALPHARGKFLAVHFPKFGFPVEQFQLGRCAALKEVNHAFGLRGKVGQQGIYSLRFSAFAGIQQRSERQATNADCGFRQKTTPIEVQKVV